MKARLIKCAVTENTKEWLLPRRLTRPVPNPLPADTALDFGDRFEHCDGYPAGLSRQSRWLLRSATSLTIRRAYEDEQTEIVAVAQLSQRLGPQLGRLRVTTRNESRHPNRKEPSFRVADGVWGVTFASTKKRKAILPLPGTSQETAKSGSTVGSSQGR